jgi:hypothetical protein
MIKKSDFTEEIPEDIKIWYNDNWLWNRYGNKWNYDCEVLHW